MGAAVLTAAAMRAAEQASRFDEWTLMQRAGQGAAQWIRRIAAGRAVTVLCGPGNNGGDGYVIARRLAERGTEVAVIAPVEPQTAVARRARADYGGPVESLLGTRRAPVLVDALFGHGLSRPLGDPFGPLLHAAIAAHDMRIAIDCPSGVDSDTGAWRGDPWGADVTLALGAWKRAHWLMPACAAMGERRLVDLDLALDQAEERLSQRPVFAAPAADAHKYTRGLVAIVGGTMPGAALLAAAAAMRAGAGYAKLFAETAPPQAPAELVTDTAPLAAALTDRRIGAVLVGPGLGRDETARLRLGAALESCRPLVLDADALHLLDWDALEGVATANLLLTPHEGELAALAQAFGIAAADKPTRAQALRDVTGASVLAKGPDTLLAPAGGGLVYFPAASRWLSVAGSGDVLAGIAAARLAAHGDAARAGEEAAWLHRGAAEIAGAGFTAGDLAAAVRPALAALS